MAERVGNLGQVRLGRYKEGMRRVTIVLSVLDGIIGALVGFGRKHDAFKAHPAYRRFESLLPISLEPG